MSARGRPDEPPTVRTGEQAIGTGNQSSWWVLGGTAITGISTYALLVATARAVGPEAYGDFGVYWAAVVIVGLGLFLPMEQETTRRGAGITAAGGGLGRLWQRSMVVAAMVAVGTAVATVVLWPWIGALVNDQVGILIAFSIACLGYCLQFPCRGLLAATRQFRGYATVVVVDSVLRALVAITLLTVREVSVVPYTLAVGGAALTAGLVGVLLVRRSGYVRGGGRVDHFGRDSARLMVAASSMQTLLNSGTLVAKLAAGPGQAALAGRVLAVMTIARLPVLLFQSLQPVYVTRLATRWHHQDRPGVRRLLVALGVATGCLAITLVIGAAVIGPWATSLFFGPRYELDRGSMVLVALGVGVYLVASVATDSSIALGLHRVIISAWAAGLLVGAVVVLIISSLLAKATLPLIVGASLAGIVLITALVVRTGRKT